jgi:TolB protein
MDKLFNTTNKVRYPFIAHQIAITINKLFNAPSINWMDKFVVFAKYTGKQTSEIIIADYTLTYQKVIIKGGLNIFPKWSTSKQNSFYYTSYKNKIPTLMRQNIYTGANDEILQSEGMIVCSDVSEDGNKLLLTIAPNSQPDIYMYDINDKVKTRITSYKGIDVGGSFVENDTKIVFVSDRLKHPNIFAKSIDSKGVERLVYHGRNNSACTTYKNYIVYSSRETNNEFGGSSFNLYLISTRSDFIRKLTTIGLNQFPKFSADGETILFIKRHRGKSYLNLIRLNYNKSFSFALKSGKLQSIDW